MCKRTVKVSSLLFKVSRKTTYRFFITYRLPQVQILDEQNITEEDRLRAEIYYAESAVRLFS